MGPPPKSETTRQFMMSDKPLHLEASLDKEIYYHGDPINVTVNINNTTNKIGHISITDVVLYSLDKYTKTVCTEEINENVAANSTFSKTYSVTPTLSANREKRGLSGGLPLTPHHSWTHTFPTLRQLPTAPGALGSHQGSPPPPVPESTLSSSKM
uniref:Arrestin-C n=1 Tax=Strix occidentalis caurina TaxID=311401 RepID=A0A8D0F5P2_STROC